MPEQVVKELIHLMVNKPLCRYMASLGSNDLISVALNKLCESVFWILSRKIMVL